MTWNMLGKGGTNMPEYLTPAEVADLLRTPAETLRFWRAVGKGPQSFKIGRRVLYSRVDVERFIAEARAMQNAAQAG
jgi:hypothetical protein